MSSIRPTVEIAGTMIPFPLDEAEEKEKEYEEKNETEIYCLNEKELRIEGEINRVALCPNEILITRIIFFSGFLFFLFQFILAFFGRAIINGFLALLITFGSFGLLSVVNKTLNLWRRQNAK